MGRKSVPFVDESSLLRMRLRDALECEELMLSLGDEDDTDFTVSAESGAPAELTLEDLYRINRNRARLIGMLHSHRSFHGAPIIVLTRDQAMAGGFPSVDWRARAEEAPALVH